jgi:hypothetical protein
MMMMIIIIPIIIYFRKTVTLDHPSALNSAYIITATFRSCKPSFTIDKNIRASGG